MHEPALLQHCSLEINVRGSLLRSSGADGSASGDMIFKSEVYTKGKPSGLIATPSVRTVELQPGDEFLLLACDGLFDVLGYQVRRLLRRK
jgi:serine/threonine protein phosphatase PrpC